MVMSDSMIGIKRLNPVWQMHICHGSTHIDNGSYLEAQTAYILAMEIAKELLKNSLINKDNEYVINMFIISCRNLAEVYRIMNLIEEAEAILIEAHSKSLEIMEAKYLPMKFRTEAYRAFQATSMVLIEFYRKIECVSKMTKIITKSRLQLQEFLQEKHSNFGVNLSPFSRN